MAIHAPIMGAQTRAPIFARFGLFNRAEIEQEIERLIALLDDADGDYDLEDDDPAGDFLDRGEGEGDHGQGLLKVRPLYAVDRPRGRSTMPQYRTITAPRRWGLCARQAENGENLTSGRLPSYRKNGRRALAN